MKDTITLLKKYSLLARWHFDSGSMAYYVENLARQADAENAPTDALYRQDNGHWVTLDELPENHQFRYRVANS